MNKTVWVFLALMVLALPFIAGCEKDDEDEDNASPSVERFNNLSASQKDSVAVGYLAENITSTDGVVSQGVLALESGQFDTWINPKNSIVEMDSVPQGWTGPDDNGWYNMDSDLFAIRVRWTPDI